MACQRDVIYWYDGTFEGFLCCVFESYANREIPWDIWYYATRQSSLFPGVDVQTDMVRAQRVLKSIREKLGQRVYYMVVRGFLNGDEGKEIRLLRFLRLMYDKGPQAAYQTGAPEVADVVQLARAVANEACQFKQFIRFEEREGMLGAVISPKHYVLPLLRTHFCDRMPNEDFLIYDNQHYVALVRRGEDVHYTRFQGGYLMSSPEEREHTYQRLWKAFYDALAIEERRNEKLRMQHCPKRFWEIMTELKDLA